MLEPVFFYYLPLFPFMFCFLSFAPLSFQLFLYSSFSQSPFFSPFFCSIIFIGLFLFSSLHLSFLWLSSSLSYDVTGNRNVLTSKLYVQCSERYRRNAHKLDCMAKIRNLQKITLMEMRHAQALNLIHEE